MAPTIGFQLASFKFCWTKSPLPEKLARLQSNEITLLKGGNEISLKSLQLRDFFSSLCNERTSLQTVGLHLMVVTSSLRCNGAFAACIADVELGRRNINRK